MKGFIEVYDQRTQFLKDIFLSHGYQINDKQSQNLDFYVVKNQKIDHDHTFSLNNINTKYIINKDKVIPTNIINRLTGVIDLNKKNTDRIQPAVPRLTDNI